jgi:hypothetical protein
MTRPESILSNNVAFNVKLLLGLCFLKALCNGIIPRFSYSAETFPELHGKWYNPKTTPEKSPLSAFNKTKTNS